jgi:hypothetical protein
VIDERIRTDSVVRSRDVGDVRSQERPLALYRDYCEAFRYASVNKPTYPRGKLCVSAK